MRAEIDRLKNKKMSGQESFVGMEGNLLEYWSWAHSDIASNTERGRLAEFIVSKAVGADVPCRVEWDEVDVRAPGGMDIEVKTSAYLQTWRQKGYSSIQFDIAPRKTWSRKANQYMGKEKRNAQVYVFCLFACRDAESANLMDLRQWEFYVLGTHVLDAQVPKQKMIGLTSLIRLGARKAEFSELRGEITRAFDEGNKLRTEQNFGTRQG